MPHLSTSPSPSVSLSLSHFASRGFNQTIKTNGVLNVLPPSPALKKARGDEDRRMEKELKRKPDQDGHVDSYTKHKSALRKQREREKKGDGGEEEGHQSMVDIL